MSQIDSLRAFVNERLTAAAEEICGAVAKTIAEFEESFVEHQKQKLNDVVKPDVTELTLTEDVLVQDEEKEVTLLPWQQNQTELLQVKVEEEHIPICQWVEESCYDIDALAVSPSPSVKSQKATRLQRSTETPTDADVEGPVPSADCRPLSSGCSEAESEDREDHSENEIENGARPQSELRELLKDWVKRSPRARGETEGSEADFETSGPSKAVRAKRGRRSTKSFEKSDSQGCCDVNACQCKVCGKSFRYKANLIKHASFHKSDQEFLCGFCGERLDSSENFTLHLESHVKERKVCATCGKSCSTEALLKIHERIHTGEKPYKCKACPKSFTHRTACTRHIMAVHPEKMYSCRDCGKEFSDRWNLKEHMAAHRGKKPHRCNFCGKGFKYIGRLNVHKKVHTGDTPYKCSVCSRGFTHLSAFQRHVKAHSGQKSYICTFCGKGFISSENLDTHRRIHTEVKAYKCDFCPKRFISQKNCKMHMRFHRVNL